MQSIGLSLELVLARVCPRQAKSLATLANRSIDHTRIVIYAHQRSTPSTTRQRHCSYENSEKFYCGSTRLLPDQKRPQQTPEPSSKTLLLPELE